MSVSIIIPQRGHQEKLTEPLTVQITEWHPDAEILVVDDGHGEQESPRGIPLARITSNPRSGLTSAWNHGCRVSTGDFLVLLNNDVTCSGPFLEKLKERAGHGIAGVVMRPDPDLQIYVLEGWCLGFYRQTFERLGGFDENFRLYFSDTDFQYRAHKLGLPLTSVPLSTLRHLGHRTAHDREILPKRERQRIWHHDHEHFRKKWELDKK